jgi:hypothetical protein
MILDEYIFLKSLIFHEFRYFYQIFKVTGSILIDFRKKKIPVIKSVNNMGITDSTAGINVF